MSDDEERTDHEGRFDRNREHAKKAGEKNWYARRRKILLEHGIDPDADDVLGVDDIDDDQDD